MSKASKDIEAKIYAFLDKTDGKEWEIPDGKVFYDIDEAGRKIFLERIGIKDGSIYGGYSRMSRNYDIHDIVIDNIFHDKSHDPFLDSEYDRERLGKILIKKINTDIKSKENRRKADAIKETRWKEWETFNEEHSINKFSRGDIIYVVPEHYSHTDGDMDIDDLSFWMFREFKDALDYMEKFRHKESPSSLFIRSSDQDKYQVAVKDNGIFTKGYYGGGLLVMDYDRAAGCETDSKTFYNSWSVHEKDAILLKYDSGLPLSPEQILMAKERFGLAKTQEVKTGSSSPQRSSTIEARIADAIKVGKIDSAGEFRDGLALVSKNGKYNYVDRDGNFLAKSGWFDSATEFQDGRATIVRGNTQAVINTEGIALTVKQLSENKGNGPKMA